MPCAGYLRSIRSVRQVRTLQAQLEANRCVAPIPLIVTQTYLFAALYGSQQRISQLLEQAAFGAVASRLGSSDQRRYLLTIVGDFRLKIGNPSFKSLIDGFFTGHSLRQIQDIRGPR
jgi:hypothetical protein